MHFPEDIWYMRFYVIAVRELNLQDLEGERSIYEPLQEGAHTASWSRRRESDKAPYLRIEVAFDRYAQYDCIESSRLAPQKRRGPQPAV